MKIKTKLTKIGRNPLKQKGFINPGTYKGSTMIFNSYQDYLNDISSEFELGSQDSKIKSSFKLIWNNEFDGRINEKYIFRTIPRHQSPRTREMINFDQLGLLFPEKTVPDHFCP